MRSWSEKKVALRPQGYVQWEVPQAVEIARTKALGQV
jgi:hypothetical protein